LEENQMTMKRIRNVVLSVVGGLGLFSLGCALSPTTQATPKTQYKAVRVMNGEDIAGSYQKVLDQESAQGWEFVDGDGGTLIFKK
jgi:hypothetical protein